MTRADPAAQCSAPKPRTMPNAQSASRSRSESGPNVLSDTSRTAPFKRRATPLHMYQDAR